MRGLDMDLLVRQRGWWSRGGGGHCLGQKPAHVTVAGMASDLTRSFLTTGRGTLLVTFSYCQGGKGIPVPWGGRKWSFS